MSQITLYRANLTCSWVPHALLRHLSIPFKSVPMRPENNQSPITSHYEAADGSFTYEEYRKNVHPMGYVPSLVVDGEVITEQLAVLTMIAQLAPDREAGEAILGKAPLEHVRVIEWIVWLSGTLQAAGFAAFWRQNRYADQHEEAYPAIKEKGRKVIESSFERINEQLRGRQYAVGDALTIVDINLYVFWVWGAHIEIPMLERFPAYADVMRRVTALPGIRAAAEEEGLPLYF
ncbi:glutathione S-transferase [Camillea tinctor]|nr:glutathione S-transferase [Camillea tinctor]